MTFLDEGDGSYVDVLRLSDHDHQTIVAELNRGVLGAHGAPGRDQRKSQRLPYHSVKGLILQVTHPGGTSARFMVKPRNLSQTGLSVLHGGFVHPGTACEVPLRDLAGQPTPVRGSVVVCRHIRGRIHEVGIEFERPIEIQNYVLDAETPTLNTQDSGVNLPSLSGRVLVVDEWEDDRRLIRYDLEKLGVDVMEADDGSAAIRRARRGRFGVIVIGEWLGDMSASGLASTLRAQGSRTPILGIFSEPCAQSVEAIRNGVTAAVDKPYRLEQLSSLLLQYLTMDTSDTAATVADGNLSVRWGEPGMRPMILSFLKNLELRLADLKRQLNQPRGQNPVQVCIRLKGAAAGYGFPQLSEAADELATLLKQRASSQRIRTAMNRLTDLSSAALTISTH